MADSASYGIGQRLGTHIANQARYAWEAPSAITPVMSALRGGVGMVDDAVRGLVGAPSLAERAAAAAPAAQMPVAAPAAQMPAAARSAALPAASATPAASAIAGSPDIEQAYARGQARYTGLHDSGLDSVVARYAEAKGGPVSLGEIAYLADIATKNTKVQPKPITPAGGAILNAGSFGDMLFQSQMAAAKNEKDPAKALDMQKSAVADQRAFVLALAAHTNPVDTSVSGDMNQFGQ